MKINEMSLKDRPRERLLSLGPDALSNAELLALLLKSGTKKENILEISNKLLAKYGWERLASCSIKELVQEHGIGKVKAAQIIALFEIFRRMRIVIKEETKIREAKDLAEKYLAKMQGLKKEQFVAVYLDTKQNVIKDETISIGTLNASLVHPREVFHGAIKNLAHSVIVLHNHPSGDPTPSKEDLQVTELLKEAGELLGIRLLDHIIVGKEKWWSWVEAKTTLFSVEPASQSSCV